jgi:hypothetical protein
MTARRAMSGTEQLEARERRIREIAHKIWEESGRPAGQADSHWEQARQIVDGQNPDFVKHKPFVSSASMSKSKQPMEPVMRNFDEILADAQKAVELSLREAFETGKAHTASELKRRMVALFEGLISGDAESHHEQAHPSPAHEGQHSDHGHG